MTNAWLNDGSIPTDSCGIVLHGAVQRGPKESPSRGGPSNWSSHARSGPSTATQRSRHLPGSLILELSIGLALFSALVVMVTQMLVARDRAEQRLEREARRLQVAHSLLEQLFHLPVEELEQVNAERVVEQQIERVAADPYLRPKDGMWRVVLERVENPLPGVKMAVRFEPVRDAHDAIPTLEVMAWRYVPPPQDEEPD